MISAINDVFVVFFCLVGVMFFIGGTIGLVRCPDLYTRLHPATKCDTLGACSIALGLSLEASISTGLLKLVLVIFLLLLTSAPSGHSIARSAYLSGIAPVVTNPADSKEASPCSGSST